MLSIRARLLPGPTTGLERVELGIVPIAPMADVLLTCGMFTFDDPCLARGRDVGRVAVAPPPFKEFSDERLAIDLEDAMRMNLDALAAQVVVGGSERRRRCTA